MAIIRHGGFKNYTIMKNHHLRDKKLSLKAKGLLSIMFSLPEDWNFTTSGLTALSSDGDASTRAAIKELEDAKYLRRVTVRKSGVIIDVDYYIYEEPYDVVEPAVENQHVANQRQLNTNIQNTNIQSINKYIVEIVEYLNKKLGTNYRSTSQNTRSHIKARLEEGFKVDDFKKVIDIKYEEWKDTDMESYLRPQTLFGTKFESYLNQKAKATSNNNNKPVYNDNEVILS